MWDWVRRLLITIPESVQGRRVGLLKIPSGVANTMASVVQVNPDGSSVAHNVWAAPPAALMRFSA